MSVSRDPEHAQDKLGLFVLAGLVVVVLGAIVVGTYWTKGVPDKGDVLLGGIATGLILFLRDLVNAIRSSWEEVTRGKVNEQLAQAGQVTGPIEVTASREAPLPVTETKGDGL